MGPADLMRERPVDARDRPAQLPLDVQARAWAEATGRVGQGCGIGLHPRPIVSMDFPRDTPGAQLVARRVGPEDTSEQPATRPAQTAIAENDGGGTGADRQRSKRELYILPGDILRV